MARSQDIGAAVALRALGHRVRAVPIGVLVNAVIADTPAVGKLRPGDVITRVNGRRILGRAGLRRALRGAKPGDTVVLTVRDAEGIRRETIKLAADPERPSRPFIGVIIEQAATIKLPLGVKIDTGNIGGPSAGLAFALDVMEELGRDVDRGRKVAATGELELDGTVLPVGGLKKKTIGARDHDIDVLLVPAGENAATAREFAGDLEIIPVRTFRQALRKLATLPQAG
jgi:PDZ domain-containing protein